MLRNRNDMTTAAHAAGGSGKFWKKAFVVYILAEAIFHVVTWLTEYSQCKKCLQPIPFYLLRYVVNLVLTALLWYGLARFYRGPWWKILAGNIFVFFLYYFLFTGITYLVINSGNELLVWPSVKRKTYGWVLYGSWYDIGKYVLILSAFYALMFYYNYRKAVTQRVQLALINKDMQLNLLRQQLNPHFYFNTLNNLYGLARSNSPALLPALNQLENIMQYVIVECNKPKVLLAQEISFLKSYIELEKLRYEKETIIEVAISGAVTGQRIIPLLLIQLVENAFKHGMKEKSAGCWMKVNIHIDNALLEFNVENSDLGTAQPQGIGISSVKKILNLQFEDKHDLQIEQGNQRFSVTLKLDLS
jgi:sensor histidine kinase YesM